MNGWIIAGIVYLGIGLIFSLYGAGYAKEKQGGRVGVVEFCIKWVLWLPYSVYNVGRIKAKNEGVKDAPTLEVFSSDEMFEELVRRHTLITGDPKKIRDSFENFVKQEAEEQA